MAKSVANALKEDSEASVLHLCGAFHCSEGLGICEALPCYWQGSALAVVCWPGSVEATRAMVRHARVPQKLVSMGDWVIVTEETFE